MAIWTAWKRAGSLAWGSLTRLIILNLLWVVVSWPLVTLGPATLAAYWWIATAIREEENHRYKDFFGAFRRFFWRGVVWFFGWVLLLGLAWANLAFWGRTLSPFPALVVKMVWSYALIFIAAMQPYLLEALTYEERPWGEALKRSFWLVMANPIYSHANLLLLTLGVGMATRFVAVLLLIMFALLLTFTAVFAGDAPLKYGQRKKDQRNLEDVL